MDYSQEQLENIGCAGWFPGETAPTPQEVDDLAIADFSDFDNVRKLARIIALRNPMTVAAQLSGELSYAYQNLTYDCAAIAQSMPGFSDLEGLQEILAILQSLTLEHGGEDVLELFKGAIADAIEGEKAQMQYRA